MDPISPLFIGAAFLAGFLMFLAPCTLPLLPAYIALISGAHADAQGHISSEGKRRIRHNALAFVIGFSLVFVALGYAAGFAGSYLVQYKNVLLTIGGCFIIALGIAMLFRFKLPGLKKSALPIPKGFTYGRPLSSFLVGVIFAIGFSPCIGPVLGTILLLATTNASAYTGLILLSIFALGHAIPFLLTAFFYTKVSGLIARKMNALPLIERSGGVFLVLLGVLMLTGNFAALTTYGTDLFNWLGLDWIYDYL